MFVVWSCCENVTVICLDTDRMTTVLLRQLAASLSLSSGQSMIALGHAKQLARARAPVVHQQSAWVSLSAVLQGKKSTPAAFNKFKAPTFNLDDDQPLPESSSTATDDDDVSGFSRVGGTSSTAQATVATTPAKATATATKEAEEEGGVYVNPVTGEVGGPRGPEPTRFGDWNLKGRVSDF